MFNIIEWLYLKQKNNKVYYDSLTGVKSRQYYDMVVKKKYHGREIRVAYVDVDNLKKINDTYGHAAGSQKLKQVSHNMVEVLRNENAEICRIGGDEFLIIGKFNPHKLRLVKDISIGVVTKEAYEDMSSAVKKADSKMYKEKLSKKS